MKRREDARAENFYLCCEVGKRVLFNDKKVSFTSAGRRIKCTVVSRYTSTATFERCGI